ncbi:hypothetical protein QQS21_006311 [Conoideocrella luteorostrata]|uniref:AB hydrolase-1 domain-containing protein n=1 Tax=Conoideocrella luteorostrata TaxID=1105319 RepID=A0AAJ0CN06_9HYPO|nr:hypothetical protein QQS21_006311 [Conoideocrella luteorostrata]
MALLKLVALAATCWTGIYASLTDDTEADIATRHKREVPSVRSYFYVGGSYADDGKGGHIFRDQMYVEQLKPAHGVRRKTPIVIIHGQAQTGTNFLNKPDGGRGWASQFLAQGYEVYLADQTLRGRSPWQPDRYAAHSSTYSAEIIEQRFTAVKKYMLWPQAALHTQWPGSGTMGDDVFDAFYSSNVQFVNNSTYQQSTIQAAGAALLDKIGKPVILMGHSQGGIMPIIIADARPELTQALVLLEPTGPPFREAVFNTTPARAWGLTDIPLTYSPPVTNPAKQLKRQVIPAPKPNLTECILQAKRPRPRKLVNLARKPILLVSSESGYHAVYDYCTVAYLKQAGCRKTKHLELGKIGIHGNGHMFFMEKNSNQIQKVVEKWISKTHRPGCWNT